jgi:leucyl-tRNA synthetase
MTWMATVTTVCVPRRRYLTYGEPGWRECTERCLGRMELFDPTVEAGFRHTLGWLNQWACSRSFGLGTKLPWDPQYLIESLSDSTIYMAYYTVAHILQQGDMFGDAAGGVRPEQLTPVRSSVLMPHCSLLLSERMCSGLCASACCDMARCILPLNFFALR